MKGKYAFLIILLIVCLWGCSGGDAITTENLVKNSDFENKSGSLPSEWRTEAYDISNRNITFAIKEGDAHSGSNSIFIENFNQADSRFFQTINVKPGSLYRLSGWIKAEGVPEDQFGANFSVLESFAASEDVKDSEGKWQYIEIFGKTGPNQHTATIACRIGGYGEESIGRAYFDDIAFQQMEKSPSGAVVTEFFRDQTVEVKETQETLNVAEARKKTNAFFWITFFSYLFLIIFFFVYIIFLKKDRMRLANSNSKTMMLFIIFMAFAFILRVGIGFAIEGQENDMSCFKGWGTRATATPWPDYYDYFSAYNDDKLLFSADMKEQQNLENRTMTDSLRKVFAENAHSLSKDVIVTVNRPGTEWQVKDKGKQIYYTVKKEAGSLKIYGSTKAWCDYPPVYIIILSILAWIQKLFHLDSRSFTLLIKMPNIIADIVCCYLLYMIAKRRLHNNGAIALSLLYAFNPAIIINAAVWGQADAIYTLLALLIVIFILDDKLWLSALILGIALLIKIQTAFVFFAGLYALIEKKNVKDWVTSVAAILGSFILFVIPFGIKMPWEWIIVQLIGTLTGYPYASVNAYNFFALLNGNWMPTAKPLLFGLSADWWGIIFGYLMMVFSIFIYFYSKEKSKNYYISMFIITGIFMFIPGMHERYLYPSIIFAMMTYIYTKDRRFLYLTLGFTISVFVNVYHILDVFIVQSMAPNSYPDYPMEIQKSPVMLINALANCWLFIYMVKVGIDVYIRKYLVVDKGVVYVQPLEAEKTELYDYVHRTLSKREAREAETMQKETPKSAAGTGILIAGIVSIILPFVGIYSWIVGKKELVEFKDDNTLKAGYLLSKSIVILWIVMAVLAGLCLPFFLTGFIKI